MPLLYFVVSMSHSLDPFFPSSLFLVFLFLFQNPIFSYVFSPTLLFPPLLFSVFYFLFSFSILVSPISFSPRYLTSLLSATLFFVSLSTSLLSPLCSSSLHFSSIFFVTSAPCPSSSHVSPFLLFSFLLPVQ
jgi:hypothetical protein